ncbi:transglutaminaseTgpA domain-containing protein [Gryllotalpicola reticulitermitis]|uniref:TransglutaminaseTgpA domain-containing protein n=1 Tax=Gryllotalpicola reticulitermitis TaxID=1184153 RepID=A0ABV8Q2W0_9MICO
MFDRRRDAARGVGALRRGAWPLAGGLLLEVVTASIALVGLMQGIGWWWALIGTAALFLAVPAALRTVGLAAWQATVANVVVFVVVIQLAFSRQQSVLGFIPTSRSVAEFQVRFGAAFDAIQSQGVPARELPELVFLFVVFGAALAIVLDALAVAIRMPATTALAMAVVFVVGAVLQPSGLSLLALGAGAGAWLLVLAGDARRRLGSRGGRAVAAGVGASVVVLSLIVAATAPGFSAVWRSDSSNAISLGSSVNPLIDLSKSLREPVPVPVLRYSTTNPEPEYLQLTTLDTFDGTVWRHRGSTQSDVPDSGQLGWPQGLPRSGVPTKTYTTTLWAENLSSPWLPIPYPTVQLARTNAVASRYEPVDHTVDVSRADLSGEKYTTTSLDLTPTLEQVDAILAAQPSQKLPANAQRDLYLPPDVPSIITKTAQHVVASAGASNPFDEAVALQNYFQDSLNGFTYSTNTPDSVDGTSLAVVARFLQQKQGYCVHFATAMAVMARVLGIPSRVAIGYLPGTLEQVSGNSFSYQVESSDLHAWPQLYFPGLGWLDFEPTVSQGAAPSYTVPTVTTTDPATSPGTTAPQPVAPVATPSAAPLAQAPSPVSVGAVEDDSRGPGGLGALVILAVLVVPLVVRQLRRRGRIGRLRQDGRPTHLAWDEVRDTARDLGLAASVAETPRAFAQRIRESWGADAALQRDLNDILEQLERTEYGPPRPHDRSYELADATQRVTRALARSKGIGTRLRALFVPVSLFQARDRTTRSARSLS